MSQGDDLQFQRDTAAKSTGQQGKDGRSDREHAGDHIGIEPVTPCLPSVIEFAIGAEAPFGAALENLMFAGAQRLGPHPRIDQLYTEWSID